MMMNFAHQAQGIIVAVIIGIVGGYLMREALASRYRKRIKLVDEWRKKNARK